jgi:WD40 repeat protein
MAKHITYFYHSKTGELVGSVPGRYPSFSPDGERVVVLNHLSLEVWEVDKQVQVWKAAEGRPGMTPSEFSPDGNYIVSGSSQDNSIYVWNYKTRKPQYERIAGPAAVHWVRISPDGQYIVAGCSDAMIRVYALE